MGSNKVISSATPSDTIDLTNKTYVDNLTPVGLIVSYANSKPPLGWFACDGSAISRTAYSSLYSLIGTTFGVGDGSTTFNLPDLRDLFVRGYKDETRQINSTVQQDTINQHTHSYNYNDHYHEYTQISSKAPIDGGYWGNYWGETSSTIQTNISYLRPDAIAATGEIESRPMNICLLYCIKY